MRIRSPGLKPPLKANIEFLWEKPANICLPFSLPETNKTTHVFYPPKVKCKLPTNWRPRTVLCDSYTGHEVRTEVLMGQPMRGNAECQPSSAEEELTFGKDPMLPVITPGLTLPSATRPASSSHGWCPPQALGQPIMLHEPSKVIDYVCTNTFDSNPLAGVLVF